MATNFIDLAGKKFGRLTVLYRVPDIPSSSGRIRPHWECLCDCGRRKVFSGDCIRRKDQWRTRSCGCVKREQNFKHGASFRKRQTPEYRSWGHMIERCTNPSFHAWKHYGGRGIMVCKRWRNFSNFLADMGSRPVGKSIDRYP